MPRSAALASVASSWSTLGLATFAMELLYSYHAEPARAARYGRPTKSGAVALTLVSFGTPVGPTSVAI